MLGVFRFGVSETPFFFCCCCKKIVQAKECVLLMDGELDSPFLHVWFFAVRTVDRRKFGIGPRREAGMFVFLVNGRLRRNKKNKKKNNRLSYLRTARKNHSLVG